MQTPSSNFKHDNYLKTVGYIIIDYHEKIEDF